MRKQEENKPFSVEQERINRINKLLARLDRIPNELDAIHEKLFSSDGFNRDEFARLVDKRANLQYEQTRVERELKDTYRLRLEV